MALPLLLRAFGRSSLFRLTRIFSNLGALGGAGPGGFNVRVRTRVHWHGKEVRTVIERTMHRRLGNAATFLKGRVRANIGIPVVRTSRGVIRSKPGEYPRKDTRRLRNDIFWEYTDDLSAVVGTTLDYGLELEIHMSRSFLRRTLIEERMQIMRILVKGPPMMPSGTVARNFGFRII